MDGDSPRALTLPRFRGLLAHPTWLYFERYLLSARLYREAVQTGCALLDFLALHRGEFTEGEHRQALLAIHHLVLRALDRDDQWAEFMRWADLCKAQTGIDIVRGRRKVIERKMARAASGQSRISDYHEAPESLPDEERARRMKQITEWAEVGLLRVQQERLERRDRKEQREAEDRRWDSILAKREREGEE